MRKRADGRRAAARTLPLLAALLAGGLTLEARAQGVLLKEAGIEVQARTPWPENLSGGYFPIRVRLENLTEEPRRLFVTADSETSGVGNEVRREVELGPGAVRELQLTAPAFGEGMGFVGWMGRGYDVVVSSGREEETVFGIGSFGTIGKPIHAMLRLAERAPAELVVDGWAEALTVGTHDYYGTEYADTTLAAAPFDEAPTSYQPYTSLEAVLIDTRGAAPPADVATSLARWARLGGVVVFDGPAARDRARAAPGFGPWLEERFLLRREGALSVHAMGNGLLFCDGSESFPSAALVGTLHEALEKHFRSVPVGSAGWWSPSIPGLGTLPWRGLTLWLVVFALLIGPVNFLVLKSRRKTHLLLVTIPGGAALTTVLLVGYGLAYQGLDVKSSEVSVAFLDQREHRVANLELRTTYAGLAPAAGLRPEEGTTVLPMVASGRVFGRAAYRIDEGAGRLLRSEFLPVRRVSRQLVQTERAARGRLEVTREGARVSVDNGLGAEVLLLLLVDAEGKPHFTVDAIAPDAHADLQPDLELWLNDYALAPAAQDVEPPRRPATTAAPGVAGASGASLSGENPLNELFERLAPMSAGRTFRDGEPLEPRLQKEVLVLLMARLVPGSYAALLGGDPFGDDMGIETNELAGRHWVVGILPEEER